MVLISARAVIRSSWVSHARAQRQGLTEITAASVGPEVVR